MTTTATTQLLPLLETAAILRDAGGPGRVALTESSIRAGEMPPLHAHEADEAVRVLEGRLTVYAGGEAVEGEAGDTYVVPRGMAHTHRADSERARYATASFVRSAARYEDFARAVARPAGGWTSPEELATLAAIAAPNAIAILGPPGTFPRVASEHAA